MKACHTLDVLLTLTARNQYIDDLAARLGCRRVSVKSALTTLANAGLAQVGHGKLWSALTAEGVLVAQRERAARKRARKSSELLVAGRRRS